MRKITGNYWTSIIALSVFCPLISATEIESVHIERKSDGTAVISNILIDDSDGTTIGVPHSSVTDNSGVQTGESISIIGTPTLANLAPTCPSVIWNCTLAGTGTADATFIDPEGDPFTVTWQPQYGDDLRIWNLTCTSGDCHTISFNHDKTDGVTIWPTACDSNSNCFTCLTWCTVY